MLSYKYGAFDYFNKNYTPTDIKSIKLSTVKEEVESNNIYDRMCAKSESEMRLEFKVKFKYDEEPITVVKEFTKNTTLSQSDVRGFM